MTLLASIAWPIRENSTSKLVSEVTTTAQAIAAFCGICWGGCFALPLESGVARTVQGLREVSIHSGAPIAIAAELVRSNRIVDQLISDRAVFV